MNDLPGHVTETVQTLAEVHTEHYANASRRQRFMDRLTSALARPISVIALGACFAAWALAIALSSQSHASDPYTALELTATVAALLVAVLILVTQTEQDKLIERRAQLALELALVADKRLAKLVALVEEVRRDQPNKGTPDQETTEMSAPVDAGAVLEEIDRRANTAKT